MSTQQASGQASEQPHCAPPARAGPVRSSEPSSSRDTLEQRLVAVLTELNATDLQQAVFASTISRERVTALLGKALSGVRRASVARELAIPATVSCVLADRYMESHSVTIDTGGEHTELPAESDLEGLDEAGELTSRLIALGPYFRAAPAIDRIAGMDWRDPRLSGLFAAIETVRSSMVELAWAGHLHGYSVVFTPHIVDAPTESPTLEMP